MDTQQSHLHPILNKTLAAVCLLMVSGLLLTGCNLPGSQASESLDEVVAATLTALAPQIIPSETSQPSPATTTAQPTSPPATLTASATSPAASATPANGTETGDDGVPGVISGSLSYPSEQIPRLAVVLFNLADGTWWWVGTAVNQTSYQMTVPVGDYHVVAYAEGGLAGGYTAAVPCGLTAACTDHSLLMVQVGSNERVTGIDVTDWYAPVGAFPAKPGSINYP